MHVKHIPLQPNDVPTRLFKTMMTDFITDLPPCEGFDSIAVYVNRAIKMVWIAPTNKTVDSMGSSKLFMRHVFPHTGLMERLISDRDPQFASQTTKALHKLSGIKSKLSTAYHPQTDGQTEHFNQELEQYLRAFCNYRQDIWVDWLPITQFVHNSHVHLATGKSPFKLLYGFIPRSYPDLVGETAFPAVNKHLEHLEHVRREARASLEIAAQNMKDQHGNHRSDFTGYKVGNKVWLDGHNIKTMITQPKSKLSAKQHGPFTAVDTLSLLTYKLDIPQSWRKIHHVFHVLLLSPFIKNDMHGSNFTLLPPDVEDNDVYNVETILDGRITRNKCSLEYLVEWEGYSNSENMWKPCSELSGVREAIDEYHARHPDVL